MTNSQTKTDLTNEKIDDRLEIELVALMLKAIRQNAGEYLDVSGDNIFGDAAQYKSFIEAKQSLATLIHQAEIKRAISELKLIPWRESKRYGINSPYITKKYYLDRVEALEKEIV